MIAKTLCFEHKRMYVIGGIAVLSRIDPHTLSLFRREGRLLPFPYAPDCPPLIGVGEQGACEMLATLSLISTSRLKTYACTFVDIEKKDDVLLFVDTLDDESFCDGRVLVIDGVASLPATLLQREFSDRAERALFSLSLGQSFFLRSTSGHLRKIFVSSLGTIQSVRCTEREKQIFSEMFPA